MNTLARSDKTCQPFSFRTATTNSRPVSQEFNPNPTLHVDYLALHYHLSSLDEAKNLVQRVIEWGALDPIDWTRERRNTKYGKVWDYGYSSAYGAQFLYDVLADGTISVCLVLRGQTLSRVQEIEKLLSRNLEGFTHCSRIDVALDGLVLETLRNSLLQALRQGNCGHLRSFRWIETRSEGKDYRTLEIGSRDSSLFARIYDKESEVLGKFQRFEIECKRELAQAGFNALLDNSLQDFYYGSLRRWEFYSEKKDKNLERNEILSEWKEFFPEKTEKVRIEPATCLTVLARRVGWLHRQVVKTLALLKQFYGAFRFYSLLEDFVSEGVSRLTDFDLRLIAREKVFAQLEF